ncbi:MAG: hypothetical protein ACE10G_08820 [Gemmatimonadales bacterium]
MMNRAIFATLVLVLGTVSSAWAARTIEQVEDAYELVLGEVSLPQRVTGTVSFRTCPTCTRTALRVTNETTYVVNGAALEFADFLEAAEAIRQINGGNENTAVYVFVDIKSRQVNRLEVDHFNG